jgi:hypothetical protein
MSDHTSLMDFLSRKQPQTPAEHVALLPLALRTVVERELAAGNTIADAGSGFPAAPVGLWVKLARPFLTASDEPPPGALYRTRAHWTWPAEFTDPQRHNFVICLPDPNASEAEATRQPVSHPAAPKAHPRPASPPPLPAPPPPPHLPHDLINHAIEHHLSLWFTPESEAAITAEVGAEGLALIKEISDFANTPAFWMEGTNMQCYYAVQSKLATRYPFLTSAAITRIATSAAWGWK